MQAILLLGAIQALFLSLLLITKKRKSTPDFILVALLIFTAIPLFLYFAFYNQIAVILWSSHTMPSVLYFVNVPFIMTFTPSIFLYIKSSLKPQKKFLLKNVFHFSPIFIFIILTFLFIDFKSISQSEFDFYQLNNYKIFLFFTPITVFLAIYYVFSAFKMFAKFNKKVKQNYSYTEDVELKWLKIILIIVSVSWFFLLFVAVFVGKNSENIEIVYKIVLFSLTIIVFVIAFFGFKQSNVFISNDKNMNNSSKNNNKINTKKNEDVEKLLQFMQEQKPYLKSKLNIKELADMLNWQPQYLSKIINENLHNNFFEFVNSYRIDEFKKQIIINKNYTILSVAFDCGFSSKSSFNRIFKENTDLTPSQYKKSLN